MSHTIIPAIIAKNQKELDAYLKKLQSVVKTVHLDVIDGKFAPNHSLQFPFRLRKEFSYHAHLMMRHPERWIKKNLEKHAGKIELFIPHLKEVEDHAAYIRWMKAKKKKVAFALNPEMTVKHIRKHIKGIDYILILAVHPGFYGSRFLKSELRKIPAIKKANPKVKVIVDGGMNPWTIGEAAKAGADFFISGSYIMQNSHTRKAMKELRKAAGLRKTAKRRKAAGV